MAFYLFPGTMYRRLKAIRYDNPDISFSTNTNRISQELTDAYALYQFCTKQYLGLGALLQFIPKTNQNRARKQLIEQLEPEMHYTLSQFKQMPPSLILLAAANSLSSYLPYQPYFTLLIQIKKGFRFSNLNRQTENIFTLLSPSKMSLKLPLFNPFLLTTQVKIYSVPSYIMNPARPVYFFVDLAHTLANRIIDSCFDILKAINADFLVLGFSLLGIKAMTSLVFGTLKAPITLVEHSIDGLFNLVYILLFNPLLHLLKSVGVALDHRGNDILIGEAVEFNQEVELREAVEKKYLTTPCPLQRKYIGSTVSLSKTHKLIAVSLPKKETPSTLALLSIVNDFNKTNTANKSISQDFESLRAANTILNTSNSLR